MFMFVMCSLFFSFFLLEQRGHFCWVSRDQLFPSVCSAFSLSLPFPTPCPLNDFIALRYPGPRGVTMHRKWRTWREGSWGFQTTHGTVAIVMLKTTALHLSFKEFWGFPFVGQTTKSRHISKMFKALVCWAASRPTSLHYFSCPLPFTWYTPFPLGTSFIHSSII